MPIARSKLSEAAYLSTKEAARLLDLHPNTLTKWRITGRGPEFVKIGRIVRYRKSTLDSWLERKTFRHTTEYQCNKR
jgi:excisionase family DNA binding protein